MRDDVARHLEIVQTVIARMAGNSFLLKGWTVTVAAALFALAAKDSRAAFAVLALFPAVSFWGLDAYYLRQERLFRKLYDDLRLSSEGELRKVQPYSLSTVMYTSDVDSWLRTMWTPAVLGLHGTVVFVIGVVIFFLSCVKG